VVSLEKGLRVKRESRVRTWEKRTPVMVQVEVVMVVAVVVEVESELVVAAEVEEARWSRTSR
jgi:hypothetical protein